VEIVINSVGSLFHPLLQPRGEREEERKQARKEYGALGIEDGTVIFCSRAPAAPFTGIPTCDNVTIKYYFFNIEMEGNSEA